MSKCMKLAVMLFQLLLCAQKGASLLRAQMSYQRGVKASEGYRRNWGDPLPYLNFWEESIRKLRFELVPVGAEIGKTKTCVGETNGQLVLMHKSTKTIPGDVIGTIDIQQPNRAFIGLQLKGQYTSIHTTGRILYFDKDGRQSG